MSATGGFEDEVRDVQEAERVAALELALVNMRSERDRARAQLGGLARRVDEAEKVADLIRSIDGQPSKVPKWQQPTTTKSRHAIAQMMLSDMHFDEVVDPAEMGGVNAYSRDIGTMRLKRFFEKAVLIGRDLTQGVTFDGAVLMLGGDSVTGEIHDELARTNEGSGPPETVLYWQEQLAAGIDMLADFYGNVSVYAVSGNHGRIDKKIQTKGFSKRSMDWLLHQQVARELRDDPRVTFTIPDSLDIRFPIYGEHHLLHHGLTGGSSAGSGIGGIWPTIMRDVARRTNVQQQVDLPVDRIWMGHWHQLTAGNSFGWFVNGSLKGYDNFAKAQSFGFEVPQQWWALATPEHGIAQVAPIFCGSREAEGW